MRIAPAATPIARRTTVSPIAAFQVAVIAALILALYAAVMLDLASEWWNVEASSYGMLVPVITAYIVYLRRDLTLAIPSETDWRGLWLTLLGCILYLCGKLSAEFFLARVSVVFVLGGITWTFWGLQRFRTLAFAFILLCTMVPLPAIVFNVIAAPLQLFASGVATNFAQAVGVSVYRDGNVIHLAKTSLGVAEACSGLNSLSSLLVGSLLLGFLENASIRGRIVLVLLSVPTAIAVNVLRIAGTAVLADYHEDFAMGFYHMLSGWLVFILGFGLLWIIGKFVFAWTRTA